MFEVKKKTFYQSWDREIQETHRQNAYWDEGCFVTLLDCH